MTQTPLVVFAGDFVVLHAPGAGKVAALLAVVVWLVLAGPQVRALAPAPGMRAALVLGPLLAAWLGANALDAALAVEWSAWSGSLAGAGLGWLVSAYALGGRDTMQRTRSVLTLAPAALVAAAIARAGCLLAGCDYGSPVRDGALAVAHGPASAAWADHAAAGWIGGWSSHSLPVHPFALYDAVGLLAAASLAYALGRRSKSPAASLGVVIAATSGLRGLAELLRGTPEAGASPFLAPALAVAALGLVAAVAGHVHVRTRGDGTQDRQADPRH